MIRPSTAIALVGALSGIGICANGVLVEREQSVAIEPYEEVAHLETPLLSARRVPLAISEPVGKRRLTEALFPFIAQLPENSCLEVAIGNETIFELRANVPLVPASNQKIVTAHAALQTMDPTASLRTEIASSREPEGAVLNGDLYFVAGGDPLLETQTYQVTHKQLVAHTPLESVADAIVASGITTINGSVVGDDSRYDQQRTVRSWPERYIRQGQAGPLSALSVNDAKTYSAIFPDSSPVPALDPPLYGATALTELLLARGVTVTGTPQSGFRPANSPLLLSVPSLPLSEIIKEMLTSSDNNTAELLTKEIAVAGGAEGTTANGAGAMIQYLNDVGIDTSGVNIDDGSGLSPLNTLTCSVLSDILQHDTPDGTISAGLPVAGVSGTLKDRFKNSPAVGVTRAKTGSLNSVSSLSGWVRSNGGADIAFSIIINTAPAPLEAQQRLLEEQLVETLLRYPYAVDLADLKPAEVASS